MKQVENAGSVLGNHGRCIFDRRQDRHVLLNQRGANEMQNGKACCDSGYRDRRAKRRRSSLPSQMSAVNICRHSSDLISVFAGDWQETRNIT
jgi:hypothetical protein